ncbi:unnamed protein product [Prorocentrum cordatum]|uniref:Uncharacterized protein n=1 Tax=Prorocentrum cordatum TaxID=2364126 RepID=A0ABN9TVP9_9DINO|nr:unnamed protein product [Polarella glacialis]
MPAQLRSLARRLPEGKNTPAAAGLGALPWAPRCGRRRLGGADAAPPQSEGCTSAPRRSRGGIEEATVPMPTDPRSEHDIDRSQTLPTQSEQNVAFTEIVCTEPTDSKLN